ncbi:GNAT family N-acetyltransferase [Lysobacter sp. CA199]|uniref:GNAT family N-acetyltransferase n=1 Tax=Lysobacter sp. CA199 TaxID=3455608 RepID=UPI003F8D89ED
MPTPRAIEPSDHAAIVRFLRRRWGTTTIWLDGRAIDASALPGFIAYGDVDGAAAADGSGSAEIRSAEAGIHADIHKDIHVDRGGDQPQDRVAGLATLLDDAIQSEIVTLDAVSPGSGLGTALIELAAQRARALGLQRLLTRTTNDNLGALRFYQRRGFRLHRLVAGAIDRERQADPAIPLVGRHGIPLRDEISLVRALDGG